MTTQDADSPSIPWTNVLHRQLQDPKRAANYLSDCFEDGPEIFFLALRDVVEARGGIGQLAKKTGLGRESLYKLLSGKQGGRLSTVTSILKALNIETTFSFKTPAKRKRKVKVKVKPRRKLARRKAA